MTVMIVDDSSPVRDLLRSMLSCAAEITCECSDGSEALDAYTRFRPDWVVMDIKMEHVDGFQATQEILSFDPNARIIMITQFNDPSLEKKALRAGAVECVRKESLGRVEEIIRSIP